jgi:hypothetical protein
MNMTRSSLTRFLLTGITLPASIKRSGFLPILAWLLIFSPSLRAQDFHVGIDFTAAIPKGEFKSNIDSNGYGIGTQFLYGIKKSPFLVGADLGFVTYGAEEFRQSLSETIPEVEVKVRTTNNIFMSHFLLRAQKREGVVRPYVDGLIGLKYLYTRTSVTNDFSDEALAASNNFSDSTFSYGAGGGVQFLLANTGGNRDILLDTKVRYLKGSNAEYLKKGSIIRGNGQVFFDTLFSRTDVLTLQIGVTFRF